MVSSTSTTSQQAPVVLHSPPLLGNGYSDPFAQFYIIAQPFYRFLRRYALTGCSASCSVHETDQLHTLMDTDSCFRIPFQGLLQFLKHDAFTVQPPCTGRNETPAVQNGMPSYSASWLIPAADLYLFLQRYALPASESPPSGNDYQIPVEQNGVDQASSMLIPAESLSQFLQLHEIPESLSYGDANGTPVEYQLDGSEDEAISASITPSQSQDSDHVNSQPSSASPSIPFGCPLCQTTFPRIQERNRHVESYLPHSIFCQFHGCTWTGRRQWDFKEHWRRKHSEAGQAPGDGANEMYDPKDFVKSIIDGTPVDEVARSAFTRVRECLGRLGRPDVGPKVLGRKRDLRKWIRIPSSQLN